MSRSAVILRNVASNWVGFAVNVAVTLALTPFVLRELGAARYGIWILTSSFIGYYGFLDLGFRTGVTQYLTRYLALKDYDKASDCISSAVAALSLLGVLMTFLSIAGAYAAPYLFTIPANSAYEAFWCILVVGISSAMQCVFSPFSAVFTAKQRFDLTNLIGIGTRLLTAVGIYSALKIDQGLLGVSIAFCGANVIDYLVRWQVACRLVPELNVSWHRAKLVHLHEIAAFGGWSFLMSVNSYIYNYVPNILIGAFMPIAAVGYYALATGLLRNVNSVLSPVSEIIYPVAIEMHAKGDNNEFERMYHDGSRLMMLVMIPVVLMASFWAEDFYRLWIGNKYLSGTPFQSVAVIFQVLLISTVTCFSSSVGQQIITATGRVRLSATLLIIGSIINLSLSLILIRPYGLLGIAAATVIASVLIDLITIPLMLHKIIGFSIKDFVFSACMRPVAAGVLQSILIMFIRLQGKPEDWFHLVYQGAVATVGFIVVIYLVGLTDAERERFIQKPLQRMFATSLNCLL